MTQKSFFYAILMVLGPFLITSLCVTRAWGTNDDTLLMCFANGFYTGQPSAALVFTSVVLGQLWCWLYTHVPVCNWYLVAQLSVSAISATVLLWRLRQCGTPDWITLALAILIAPIWVAPTYSATAMLAAGAGTLLLLEETDHHRTGRIAGGLALLLLGLLLRWHGYLVVWALAVPVWMYQARSMTRWRTLLWPAALLLLFFVQHIGEARWYQTYYQHDVFGYQSAIDRLVSTPNRIEAQDMTAKGLTINDLAVIKNWFWVDTDVFHEARLMDLAAGQAGIRSLYDGTKVLASLCWLDRWYLLALMGLLLPLMKLARRSAPIWPIAGVAAIVAGACLYGAFLFRLPHRLVYPMVLVALVFVLYLLRDGSVHRPTVLGKNLSRPMIYLGIVVMGIIAQLVTMQHLHQTNQSRLTADYQYIRSHPEQIFLVRGSVLDIEAWCHWGNIARGSPRNMIPCSWSNLTPAHQAILQHHGIRNPAKALIERDDLVLVGPQADLLATYYAQNYGINIRIEPIEGAPAGFVRVRR
jgi:hypothetical protein